MPAASGQGRPGRAARRGGRGLRGGAATRTRSRRSRASGDRVRELCATIKAPTTNATSSGSQRSDRQRSSRSARRCARCSCLSARRSRSSWTFAASCAAGGGRLGGGAPGSPGRSDSKPGQVGHRLGPHRPVEALAELGLVEPAVAEVPGEAIGDLGSLGVADPHVSPPASWPWRTERPGERRVGRLGRAHRIGHHVTGLPLVSSAIRARCW